MTQVILTKENTAVLFVAFELSASSWKLAISVGGKRVREVKVDAGDLEDLGQEFVAARKRFDLAEDAQVVSCYEAGRDGFWLHRYLTGLGVRNVVVDSSSIEVDRRARRAKTDRLDARRLLGMLARYHGGDEDVWSVVRVPTVENEDRRRAHREIERLKSEKTGHTNRIRGLLNLHGVRLGAITDSLAALLDGVRLYDGSSLPAELRAELVREHERLVLARRQLRHLEQVRLAKVKEQAPCDGKVSLLMQLKAVGINCAWVLGHELFGWRKFQNRRQLAGCVGLTPTPFQSGDSSRDQGISKSGNPRVRALLIEIAWGWLRWQPDSALSKWYMTKFGGGPGRMRRIGIVALARRLLIALWRFVENGVVPEGALLKVGG
jgi:transposase